MQAVKKKALRSIFSQGFFSYGKKGFFSQAFSWKEKVFQNSQSSSSQQEQMPCRSVLSLLIMDSKFINSFL